MQPPKREYRSVIWDSRRWEHFSARPGDVFVCSPPKCGTTWMQTIVTALLHPDGTQGPVFEIAPWFDARFEPVDTVRARLDAQDHRRQIKTHTPVDGIPWFDDAQYIVVARDGRDAFMSFHNHLQNVQPALLERLLFTAIDEGIEFAAPPPPVHDIHEYFAWWLEHGGFFHHIDSFWNQRGEPNVSLFHYNDMKADLDGQMRCVAAFLGIEVDERRWTDQVASCTFAGMKARPDEIADFESHFVGGAATFLYKAKNGRWLDVLTAAELDAYDATVAATLLPECAAWLAGGTAVSRSTD